MFENLNIEQLKAIIISQEKIIQEQDDQISNLINKQFKACNKFMSRDLDLALYLTREDL